MSAARTSREIDRRVGLTSQPVPQYTPKISTGSSTALAMLESTGTHGMWVDAQHETWSAASLALRGESAEALAAYVSTLKRWAELGTGLG